VAIMRVYIRLGCAIGLPIIKRPDGTDGVGSPFAGVSKPPAAASSALEVTAAPSGKTATTSVTTK
jgi:hypothetical protein